MNNFESLRIPKYVQLMIKLREQIEEGKLKPGDPLPTREQLMREFDISLSTVTRAVSELERQGWLLSRQGSGTFVVKRSDSITENINEQITIGLLLPLSNAYSQEFAVEFINEAHTHHIQVIAMYAPDDEEVELNQSRLLFEKSIDALVWTPIAPKRHVGVASVFGKNKIPVLITEKVTERFDPPLLCVQSDYYEGTKSALDYLFELGHNRVAYIGPKGSECDFGPVIERWNAYKDEMKDRGLWNPDEWVMKPSIFKDWPVHTDRIKQAFSGAEAPTAILAFDDATALEAARGLSSIGIRIPEDMALIGHGDNLAGHYSHPRLTTVAPATAELVDTLFRVLLKEIQAKKQDTEPSEERIIKVPQRLLLRESTSPLRGLSIMK